MIVDKSYCASSFLMYRTIADSNKAFKDGIKPILYSKENKLDMIENSYDLENSLKRQLDELSGKGKIALALSAGIDSAILARFMPKDSIAYTFKCVVPGQQVIDESIAAAKYAKECGLKHKVIEIYWEDFEKYAPLLMRHKGAPIHSIEVQIYKAALEAKKDGIDIFVFGESSDLNYGGLSGLLSKDWTFGEFVDRYSYVKPYHVLKDSKLILEPYKQYEEDGYVNVFEFMRNFFLVEAMGSYTNACDTAGIKLATPYVNTYLSAKLDIERIRSGDNKYIVREVFKRLYPNYETPTKTPMPRPMNEWFAKWQGPTRQEFWPHCTDNMTGDQKWLVWALEKFFDIIE